MNAETTSAKVAITTLGEFGCNVVTVKTIDDKETLDYLKSLLPSGK